MSAAIGCGDDDEVKGSGTLADAGGVSIDGSITTPDVGGSVGRDGAAPLGEDAATPLSPTTPVQGIDAGTVPTRPVLYAMTNEIYTDDDSTTYVNALPSLDIKGLDVEKAIEFGGGRATIGTVDGKLFVADPSAPVVTRYAVSDAGLFSKETQISFAGYTTEGVTLDEWSHVFVSPTKAYLFIEDTGIVWNPSTMEIVGEIDHKAHELSRTGFELNGSGAVARGNRVYRTVYWTNWDTWTFSPEQFLAVYDTDTDKLISLTPETRCPALGNRAERDEAGNLYFSNWVWNVPNTLVRNDPKSCVLRLPAGSDSFDSWQLSYADLAEGREGAMFAYLGNGQAMVSIFHGERTTWDASTPLNEIASTDNWRLWKVDLATKKAAPIESLDWNGGAVSTYHLDGRHFLILPGEMWSITHVHEIVDGASRPLFDAKGWSYQLLKLR